jgi:hypothetical protein
MTTESLLDQIYDFFNCFNFRDHEKDQESSKHNPFKFIPIDPDNINNEEIYYSNADFKNTDNVVVLDKEEINFQMDDLYLNDSVNYNKILIKEEEQKEEQKENKFFELKYRKYITSQYL